MAVYLLVLELLSAQGPGPLSAGVHNNLLRVLRVLCSENLGAVGLFGQQEPRAPGAWGVYNSPNVGGRFYAAVLGVSVTSNPKPSRRLTR